MKRRLEIIDDTHEIPRYMVKTDNGQPSIDNDPPLYTDDFCDVLVEIMRFRIEGKG